MNEFERLYGDPDWGKMKAPDYPELVRNALKSHPGTESVRLVGIIMREQGGKVNPQTILAEIERQKS